MEYVMIGLGAVALLIAVALVAMRAGAASQDSSNTAGAMPQKSLAPAASVNRRANWLEGTGGRVVGKTFHIGSRDATIGRKVGNYIQIIDDDVSRVHVSLKGTSTGVEVTDQNSSKGTTVNGAPLVSGVPRMLADGDVLKIGGSSFKFHAQADFPENHGLTAQKIAGQAQNKQTAALGQLNWRDEVTQALVNAGGDKQAAADAMNVSLEVYEKMLEQVQER